MVLLITIESIYTFSFFIQVPKVYNMRKNILIFGHGYANGFIEATNQYTSLFDKNKFNVTVVYLDGEPCEKIKNKHLATDIIFLNASTQMKRGLKLQAIKTMLALHRNKQFQIVICHRYKPSYIMLWVKQFIKIPALFCVMHEMKTLKSLPRKLLVAALASKNTIFAGVSNAVREDIKQNIWRVPPNQIITLYNMIDVEKAENELLTRQSARAQLNLTDDTFVFGILGRLVKAKDHTTLINAFAIAKAKCPTAKLLIIGEGELESQLKQQANELNLKKDIIFTGFLPNAPNLLKAFDVFVLSSVKEAFGRVLIEAMVAKIPIIATKTNGIPEVVGDAGFLVDKQNPKQLAENMFGFYNMTKSELNEWSERSYQRASSHFSMRRFQEEFWQLPLLN